MDSPTSKQEILTKIRDLRSRHWTVMEITRCCYEIYPREPREVIIGLIKQETGVDMTGVNVYE